MHLTHNHAAPSDDRLLLLAWKVIAGLAITIAIVYLGTVVVESVLPTLPDQARASTAMPAIERSSGANVQGGQPASVEHFHAQFNLRPGADSEPYVQGF